MASGNAFSSDGTNTIQTFQGFPNVAVQVSGAIPNLQYGPQQLGTSASAPQQVLQKGPLERFFNAEIKVLGAVQIMIGLMHIGFGAVAVFLVLADYISFSVFGGYSFWAGILFISSGSLCVSVAKNQNRSLVKCSIGMNITSAIIALFGILQYILELSLSDSFSINNDSDNSIKAHASPACCSCSDCWNFSSLFHLHILDARQLAVLMTRQPLVMCLTK